MCMWGRGRIFVTFPPSSIRVVQARQLTPPKHGSML
jgi:hypothetical protein